MGNISVVVNYEKHSIFPAGQADGYLQFTRSGDWVYISEDSKDVGIVKYDEFVRLQKLLVPADDEVIVPRDLKEYALRHGYGR